MNSRWRKSLERLQRRFEVGASSEGHCIHYLVVYPASTGEGGQRCFDPTAHLPPDMDRDKAALSFGGGYFVSPEVFGDVRSPQQGWASVFVGDREAFIRFVKLAESAGQLLTDFETIQPHLLTPHLYLPGLPLNARCMPNGMAFGRDVAQRMRIDRWMLLVHELGWTWDKGSALRLHRIVWAGEERMAYADDDDLRERLTSLCGGMLYSDRLRDETTIPPSRYYSVLDTGLFMASSDAVQRLLEITGESNQESPVPITITAAAKKYEVTPKTLRLAAKAGRLRDLRAHGHAPNAKLVVDERQVQNLWGKRV